MRAQIARERSHLRSLMTVRRRNIEPRQISSFLSPLQTDPGETRIHESLPNYHPPHRADQELKELRPAVLLDHSRIVGGGIQRVVSPSARPSPLNSPLDTLGFIEVVSPAAWCP